MTSAPTSTALRPLAMEPMRLGEMRPRGWLERQLRIQAEGLTGHLDEFWPDVKESGWIGGSKEGWERGPYWLDGAYPLAVLLDDAALKAKVTRWVDYVLAHQHEDGWLGPVTDGKHAEHDPWPVTVMLKVLVQHQQATGDGRVVPAMQRFLRRLDGLMDEQPLRSWGRFRWADLAWCIHWLYDQTGEGWLLTLAEKGHRQGFDWRGNFENFKYAGKNDEARLKSFEPAGDPDGRMATHVVNAAMGVKAAGVWYRQSQLEADRVATATIIDTLDRHHGQATGVFSGDEHLATTMPSQGTETCAVVEYLFSLEVLLAILGEAGLADRLELIAYNALPAPFKPDMWARQYDQQANQIACDRFEDCVYTNNGPEANMYGLETHFGCCTANMHQGWPKFAAHLWMRRPAEGGEGGQTEALVALAYAPCEMTTKVGGADVTVQVKTEYPFDDKISITVTPAPGSTPGSAPGSAPGNETPEAVRFAVELRIPAWAEGATVTPGSEKPQAAKPGAFHRLEREWSGATTLLLTLPMKWRLRKGYNDSLTLMRGPLVFSLNPGDRWEKVKEEGPAATWRTLAERPWNYALAIDPATPGRSISLKRQPMGDCPFSPEGSPLRAYVPARRVPQWGMEHNAAAPPPASPVQTAAPIEQVELLPYGCTNLRVTELPWTGTAEK